MMEKRTKLRVFLAYGLFIIVLANMPGQYLPGILTFSPGFNHMMAFLVMGFLLDRAMRLTYVEVAAILISIGYLIEWMQLLGGYREFSLIDLLFDMAGITLYIVLTHFYKNRIKVQKSILSASSNPMGDVLKFEPEVPVRY